MKTEKLKEKYHNNEKVIIVDSPKGVLDKLQEIGYNGNDFFLAFGLVSVSGRKIKSYMSLGDALSAYSTGSRFAKPVREVLEKGYDELIDVTNFDRIDYSGLKGLSVMDKYFSPFDSSIVQKNIENLRGALPSIAVVRYDENHSNVIGRKDISKQLDYIVIMNTK